MINSMKYVFVDSPPPLHSGHLTSKNILYRTYGQRKLYLKNVKITVRYLDVFLFLQSIKILINFFVLFIIL